MWNRSTSLPNVNRLTASQTAHHNQLIVHENDTLAQGTTTTVRTTNRESCRTVPPSHECYPYQLSSNIDCLQASNHCSSSAWTSPLHCRDQVYVNRGQTFIHTYGQQPSTSGDHRDISGDFEDTDAGKPPPRSLREKFDFLYWLIYVNTCLRSTRRRSSVTVAGGMTTVANVLRSRRPSDAGKAVKYTPCSKGDQTDEEELDEIEVVRQSPKHSAQRGSPPRGSLEGTHHSPSGSTTQGGSCADVAGSSDMLVDGGHQSEELTVVVTANGPNILPGSNFQSNTDRTRLIGERLAGSTGRINISSPVYSPRQSNASNNSKHQRTTSRGSIFEVVSNKIENVKSGRKNTKDYSHAIYENKAHNVEPATPKELRKQRKKDIETKFGKKSKYEKIETSTTTSSEKDGCKWTFVFDPSGRFAYWWSAVVSVAFVYNFWVIIYRFAFDEINRNTIHIWFTLDYIADFLYVLDIVFHFRTGYLEDGVLQTDGTRLRLHYMNSTMFYIDCLCLLPLDFLYLSISFKSMLRCFRLVKIYRFWAFLDRTERHTNYPNLVRTVNLLHYLVAIYHWNACVMYLVIQHLDNENWEYPKDQTDVLKNYLHSLYWSTLTLTTIGDLPRPKVKGEYVFVILQFVFGLLLFSAVLGHVANIVTSISFARKDFQAKLDSVKTYMSLRRVPLRLQDRVIKWFDYLWLSKKSSDEEKTLSLLPDKLKAEIALHVHLDTLKRVEIFQNTEAGFLCDLVLKLRPVLFSPGDYICTKGEVGKEMYIVNRGRLQVVNDHGKTILATLRPGSYFGEISILNMGNEGNRRTASVRSVGYSDLFVLSKKDLWEVLKDYPTARVRLEAIAVKRLEKYKKTPLENANLSRSRSTPGLVESTGKVPLSRLLQIRNNTLPAGLPTTKSLCDSELLPDAAQPGSSSGSHHSTRSGGCGTASVMGSATSSVRDAIDAADIDYNKTASADLTHSMTVSSITSYVTDNSLQQSPRVSEAPKTPLTAAVSGTNTRATVTLVAPSAFKPVDSYGGVAAVVTTQQPFGFTLGRSASGVSVIPPQAAAMDMMGTPSAYTSTTTQNLSMLNPPTVAYLTAPGMVTPVLSPCPSPLPLHKSYHGTFSTGTHPSHSSSFLSMGSGGMPSSTHSAQNIFPYSASVSPHPGMQQTPTPHQDALLSEIGRLRERIHTLEGENTSMSFKLNKQQWEVENRLSEIEMQICGSESGCSRESMGDDKSLHGNRESII